VRHGAPIHATALVLADRGVLIRGDSGSGKTALALELFARARTAGLFAALVCDDQVPLSVLGNRLVGFAATPLAGLVEVRGLTPRPMPWVSAAVIDLVVTLVDRTAAPRFREPETDTIRGCSIDALVLPMRERGTNADTVFFRLGLWPFGPFPGVNRN
jgi:serine kinase of HPr protein (carbohydrate metabolism regulator)